MTFDALMILAKKGVHLIAKNSPAILTVMGSAGVVMTGVFAGNATLKADEVLTELKQKEGKDELTLKEKFLATWKYYIPTVIVAATSIACIIGSHGINAKRNAALATMYATAQESMKEYQKAVVETIGEKEEDKVREKVAKADVNKNTSADHLVCNLTDQYVCKDGLTKQEFIGNWPMIKDLYADFKAKIAGNMYGSVNEWLDMLPGCEPVDDGEYRGYTIDDVESMEITHRYIDDDRGRHVLYIEHLYPPKYNYDRVF